MQLQASGWMSREDGAKFFKSDKLIGMVFSDEVLKEKRNTEAVEVSPNNLVSARVLEYKAEKPKSFDEVRVGIEAVLKLEQALKLAQEKGEAKLAKLSAGDADEDLEWTPPVTVDRKNAQGFTEPVMNRVFKINTAKLPAYTGFADGNRAYVFLQVSRVDNALAADEEAKKTAEIDLESALAAEYISAFGKSLKANTTIEVNRKLLESDAQ
ncbi:MAG: hypothetical protein ACT4OH_00840 [Methylophilaceae bacterium]